MPTHLGAQQKERTALLKTKENQLFVHRKSNTEAQSDYTTTQKRRDANFNAHTSWHAIN